MNDGLGDQSMLDDDFVPGDRLIIREDTGLSGNVARDWHSKPRLVPSTYESDEAITVPV